MSEAIVTIPTLTNDMAVSARQSCQTYAHECICFALPSFTFVCLLFDANKVDINTFKARKLEKRLSNEETSTAAKQLSYSVCFHAQEMSPNSWFPLPWRPMGASSKRKPCCEMDPSAVLDLQAWRNDGG